MGQEDNKSIGDVQDQLDTTTITKKQSDGENTDTGAVGVYTRRVIFRRHNTMCTFGKGDMPRWVSDGPTGDVIVCR